MLTVQEIITKIPPKSANTETQDILFAQMLLQAALTKLEAGLPMPVTSLEELDAAQVFWPHSVKDLPAEEAAKLLWLVQRIQLWSQNAKP